MAHPVSGVLDADKQSMPAIPSLEALLASIDGMVYRCLADATWSMEFVSQGAFELTGYHPEELLGHAAVSFDQIIFPDDREHVRQVVHEALGNGAKYELEYRLVRKSGELRWVVERGSAVKRAAQGVSVLEGIIQDVTNRKKSDENRLEAERRYRSIFQNAIEGIYQSTLAQGYLDVNPALARIYGYDSPSQLIEGLRDIGSQLYVDLNRRLEFMQIMERHGSVSNFESRVYRRDGTVIWISENARAVRSEAGEVLFYEGTVEDITQRKFSESEIHFRATHDPLTRLANRTLLEEHLEQAIDVARRDGKCVAVAFLDLDKFKYINDSLGHQSGDELLVTIADRLRHCVRESDTVARLGGDEFVLVLVNQLNQKTVEKTVQRILADVAKPWIVNGVEVQVTCSVGVSLFPAHGSNSVALLRHADAAMFEAKRLGRNTSQYFSENLDDAGINGLEMISSLRRSIENQEFLLHYQPKCDLTTGAVVGAEALIRWQRPGLRILGPNEFLPLAEDAGLMEKIGEWVVRTACLQNRAWQDAGFPPIAVSVNVSPLQLERESLVPQVAQALRDSGLDPRYLEIEVTENGMMRHVERSMQTLRRLKELGVRISIDDFGTGYSSLGHLKHLPLDTLKIDKSFIRNISSDYQNASIVKAVISLAHSLNLNVVGEGVETEEEYEYLGRMGCNEIQGYYRGRPVPAQKFSQAYFQAPEEAAPAA